MELQILHMIQNLHAEWLNPIMIFVTKIAENGEVWILLSIILAIIPKTRKCGLTMMASMALTFLLGNVILKNVIARPRPCAVDSSVKLLIPFPGEYSFPSGHSSNGFSAATVIFAYYHKAGVFALLGAAVIAFSRMYLFVHYPTDILGGMLLGILDACLMVWIFKVRAQKKQLG